MNLEEKRKVIDTLQKQITKAYGTKVLLTGKEAIEKGVFDVPVLPTTSIELNKALWCGGLSGIVELYGPESSGKTSLAIETLAKAQKDNPEFIGLWLETEHSIYPTILQQHGVDLNRLLFVNQEDVSNAENALDIVCAVVGQGAVNMVVVNSVAGLEPKKETEEELKQQNVALTARIMSKFFRKITGLAGKNKVTMIFINQLRANVGVMFGDNTTTTGGKALGYYAHQRIRMNKIKPDKSDPVTPEEGGKVSCIVHKNRYAGMNNPNTKCSYFYKFSTGIDSVVGIPQLLEENNIFKRGGAYWYYKDKDNIQTLANVQCKFSSLNDLVTTLRENEDFRNEVVKLLNVEEVSMEEKEEIEAEEQKTSEEISNIEKDISEDKSNTDN